MAIIIVPQDFLLVNRPNSQLSPSLIQCYNLLIVSILGRFKIEIIPSIDIRDGRCVRLYQGDYNRETVFSDDPLDVALKWQSMGAPRLHIVDLDGAASGEILNLDVIKEIVGAMLIPTQLGGGIRDLATIEKLLKTGVERVILGTVAVVNQSLVREALERFHESIITHGWLQDTGEVAMELAKTMVEMGARRFVYTDISRDGTLTEPNFSAVSEILDAVGVPVIAAGGISSINHLKMLSKLGVEGAIVGKALYTGDINLKQALDEVGQL
jgi:phosphoribosylformimino-5-aminoimidazole carboxamide ribotide isomerase